MVYLLVVTVVMLLVVTVVLLLVAKVVSFDKTVVSLLVMTL
jgi:hypothetical protein